ncbi:MAG: PEGA domain-containing protein [Myxococcota bacterium]
MSALLLLTALSAAGAPLSVAILELEGPDPDLNRQLTARVAELVGRQPKLTVVAPDDIRALLRREEQRQLLGCTDQSCLAEIAGALGADQIISGRVSELDGAFSVSLTRVDAAAVASLGRASGRWGGARIGLLDLMDPLVAGLFADTPEALAGAIVLAGAESGSEVVVDGVSRGTTPPEVIPAVPAGGRKVELTKGGFRPFSGWVVVRPSQSTQLVVEQQRLDAPPITRQWWFWTALGLGAAGAAVGSWAALSGGDSTTGVQVGVNVDDAITGGR